MFIFSGLRHRILSNFHINPRSRRYLKLSHGKNGGLSVIFDNPKHLNALTPADVSTLSLYLKNLKKSCPLVIFRGENIEKKPSFSSGADLNSFTDPSFIREMYGLFLQIGRLKERGIVGVSILNGIVMGAGCGVALNSQFKICTEETRLSFRAISIIMFPSASSSFYFPKNITAKGLSNFLSLTGAELRGQSVFKAGLATHYIGNSYISEIEERLLNLKRPNKLQIMEELQGFAKKCPLSSTDLNEGFDPVSPENLGQIASLFESSEPETILQRLRESRSEFGARCLKGIGMTSPLSLKLTARVFESADGLELAEALKLECRVAVRAVSHRNVKEAIKRIVSDRDYKPKWEPPSLEGVTDEMINGFFEPFSNPQDELII